ncbi:hypothetical protein RJ55_05996 [Drechmeria coniospora]|nr:hypothetical protein RJ55_05996 [Drechmeria coniospora]
MVPDDVFTLMAENLDFLDLLALSLVCKATRKLVSCLLWRTIVIRPKKEDRPELVRIRIPPGIPQEHMRAICFRNVFEHFPSYRCIHWDEPEGRTSSGRVASTDWYWLRAEDLSQKVDYLIKQFRKRRMDSFSWEMGICLPGRFLELLARIQPRLQDLTLVTDGHCPEEGDRAQAVSLSNVYFPHLRKLTWIGPGSVVRLWELFSNHADQLEEFEMKWTSLDLMEDNFALADREDCGLWALLRHGNLLRARAASGGGGHRGRPSGSGSETPFLSLTPSLPPGRVEMPYLRSLSLSHVTLGPLAYTELDLLRLESLTLRDCPSWVNFCQGLVDSGMPLSLKCLELQSGLERWEAPEDAAPERDWIWVRLIDAVDRLEELYVSVRVGRPVPSVALWDHVSKHRKTLTTFVHHFREDIVDHPDRNVDDGTYDVLDLGIKNALEHIVVQRAFMHLHLDALGLPCDPRILPPLLEPFRERTTLKFIHIRQSASDAQGCLPGPMHFTTCGRRLQYPLYHGNLHQTYNDCLTQIFGRQGVPSVEQVAFGDFSIPRCRSCWKNFIAERDTTAKEGFRFLELTELEGFRALCRHRRILESCPWEEFETESVGPSTVELEEARESIMQGYKLCAGKSPTHEVDPYNEFSDAGEPETDDEDRGDPDGGEYAYEAYEDDEAVAGWIDDV